MNKALDTGSAVRDRDALARQVELMISNVLRGGVLLSAAIILVGVVMFYVQSSAAGHAPTVLRVPRTLSDVGTGLGHGDPVAIIALGLLILLATPVIRVAVSILAFVVERDWRYVVITSIVLFILLLSFFLGRAGA
jgi:uncharacterized membrane protein